jgi:two-component system, OmpR family, sensor histidine kinase KdpD
VSHDLRTPLASIKASVSTLRHDDQDEIDLPPDVRQRLLADVESETDRLTALVTNLLALSRLQAGALAPELRPVALDEVVPAAVAGLGDGADRVTIEIPESVPRVMADPALLERAVANLVDNAVAHSPADVPVRVEAGAVGERVDVRIVDRGPGIPEVDRSRIFEPFQRLDDRRTGGVGVGLAVARGFVVAMGGELSVEDTPGGGTTMVVSLAAVEESPPPEGPARASAYARTE